MKNSVLFYKDWYEVVKEFSPEERLQAYDAIMLYAFEGVVPADKFIKAATALMRTSIDRDNEKYEEKSERNRRNVAIRWQKLREAQQAAAKATEPIRTNTDDTQEQPAKEVKKKTATAAVKRFVKPNAEQVAAYCKERGNYVDARQFVDFYESKGWKVGNSPMKDWKAAVRTWEQRDGRARKPAPKGVTLGVGEWIDERGERRYGTGQHVVPMSAPPRPSDGSYWSSESNQWISGV